MVSPGMPSRVVGIACVMCFDTIAAMKKAKTPAGGTPSRITSRVTGAMVAVGAMNRISVIIGQVGKDLQEDGGNDAKKKNIKPEKMNILLVGDKARIMEGVRKLGYEIVELDVDGNKVEKKAF